MTSQFFIFMSVLYNFLVSFKRGQCVWTNAKAGRLHKESPRHVDCYNCSVRNLLRQRG